MDALTQLVPFLGMFLVMYFLLIRPQLQERQSHEKLVQGLVKDDAVVTAGGVHGRVVEVTEQTIKLEIAKNVTITVDKGSVAFKLPSGSSTGQG